MAAATDPASQRPSGPIEELVYVESHDGLVGDHNEAFFPVDRVGHGTTLERLACIEMP